MEEKLFDTYVTVVGNVLTAPEWRRTSQSGALVANFKVASTARRLDRESGRWVDGNSLRVRVNCWRKLAEGVASSVMVGDPVLVAGRLYTRDWVDEAGNHRTMYELEAVAVGHDLSRGRSRFFRNRPTLSTSTTENPELDVRVRGEMTEPVPADAAPVPPDDQLFDDQDDGLPTGIESQPGEEQRFPEPFPGPVGEAPTEPEEFDRLSGTSPDVLGPGYASDERAPSGPDLADDLDLVGGLASRAGAPSAVVGPA